MKATKCCVSVICGLVVGVCVSAAVVFLVLQRVLTEQPILECAGADEALCGSESDYAVISSYDFQQLLFRAGHDLYSEKQKTGEMHGVESLEKHLQEMSEQKSTTLSVSKKCVSCQAESLQCAVKQASRCLPACFKACSKECKACIDKACSVRASCGGIHGVSIQMPFTCPDGEKAHLAPDATLVNESIGVNCQGGSNSTGSDSTTGRFLAARGAA